MSFYTRAYFQQKKNLINVLVMKRHGKDDILLSFKQIIKISSIPISNVIIADKKRATRFIHNYWIYFSLMSTMCVNDSAGRKKAQNSNSIIMCTIVSRCLNDDHSRLACFRRETKFGMFIEQNYLNFYQFFFPKLLKRLFIIMVSFMWLYGYFWIWDYLKLSIRCKVFQMIF